MTVECEEFEYCKVKVNYSADSDLVLEKREEVLDAVKKMNVKESFLIHLKDGETRSIPLERLDFMKRPACQFCADYAAEFADISCGGIGAPEGQTTVIIRTLTGRKLFNDACGQTIELFNPKDNANLTANILKQIDAASSAKKRLAAKHRQTLY